MHACKYERVFAWPSLGLVGISKEKEQATGFMV